MHRRSTPALLLATTLVVIGACWSAPRDDARGSAEPRVLALVGGAVVSAPDAAPIADGVLVIEGERIVAVGPRARVRVPAGAAVIDVRGHTVLPGFWNSHVYELMAGAGLNFRSILASLTTAPAEQFGRGSRTGRLAPGFDADVVVVRGDPTQDIRALGRVRLTLKRGRDLYDAEARGTH